MVGCFALSAVSAMAQTSVFSAVVFLDDRSFFDTRSHVLINWEFDGAGGPVLLSEGQGRFMPDTEYEAMGLRFSPDSSAIWQDPGADSINGAQFIGGSPHNFLGINLFGEDAATEFIFEFVEPVSAVGFWMQLGKSLVPPVFEARAADGTPLATIEFSGMFVDGTFDDFINYGFMGLASETPIASLALTVGLENGFFLDDLRFTPIPTPGVLPLAFAATGLTTRRRRSAT